jgi:hypothetical protein
MPYGALRLNTESDLSQCSLDSANDVLVKHFMDKNLKKDGFHSVLNVSVDDSDLTRTIDLARAWNMRLQLKRTYEWDEWSVTWGVAGDFSKVTLWSSGA